MFAFYVLGKFYARKGSEGLTLDRYLLRSKAERLSELTS